MVFFPSHTGGTRLDSNEIIRLVTNTNKQPTPTPFSFCSTNSKVFVLYDYSDLSQLIMINLLVFPHGWAEELYGGRHIHIQHLTSPENLAQS